MTATEDDDAIGGLRTLAHTVTGYGTVPAIASVAVTVIDNDTAGVTISETAVEVTEGAAAVTYMVGLSSAPAVSATVTIDPGSSTTAPITVAPAALTLTFGSGDWDTAQAVTVTATEDDDAIGGLRTLAHTVTGYGTVPAVASVAVTVIDNDTAGVTISETAVEVTEGAAAATYMVVLSSAPAVSATVTIDPGSSTTAPITVAPAALTLTFGSGDWDTAQAVTVTATEDDDAIGGLRTLAHTVTGYGTLSAVASVAVTVIDNDTAGVTISETAVEVTEGAAAATYMVVLSSAPAVSATVTIDPGSSTTAPITVTPAALTLTFGSDDWDTAQAVTVTATEDDDAIGGLRTLAHTVTGYGDVSGAASVAVTVIDNDTAGVTIDPTTLTVTEGGEQTYTVVLNTEPAGTVVVSIAAASDTVPPITFSPASLSFDAGTWADARTVTVTAAEDDDALGGTRTLTHTVTNYPGVTRAADVLVTVNDNDTAGVTISETAVEVTEGAAAATYMVVLSSAPAVSATVTIDPGSSTTAPITVAPGGPYPHDAIWFGLWDRLGHCPSCHRDGHRG